MNRVTNTDRLWESLMTMAKIGAIPNDGSCRLALTDEDKAARDLFVEWCRQAGCAIQTDRFGNIFAIRAGQNLDLPIVLVGSHLDTQPRGGRFDGVLGVLAGLELLRTLNDADISTEASIAVVNWTNEEGVRFSPGLTGSKGFAGDIAPDRALGLIGSDGATFGGELTRIGYAGDDLASRLSIGTYLELHIEQGPILERMGKNIGVVDGIQGVRWYTVELQGQNSHAGTTPLKDRRDSFMAACRLALDLRTAAMDMDETIRLTVGRVTVDPGSLNTVPGRTTIAIDLRHRSEEVLDLVETEIHRQVKALSASEGVDGVVTKTMTVLPVAFDAERIALLEQTAEQAGLPYERMSSGAMHDASSMARIVPSAMIFVPSRNGVSHDESEWTEPAQVGDGCELLARTAIALASPILPPHATE